MAATISSDRTDDLINPRSPDLIPGAVSIPALSCRIERRAATVQMVLCTLKPVVEEPVFASDRISDKGREPMSQH